MPSISSETPTGKASTGRARTDKGRKVDPGPVTGRDAASGPRMGTGIGDAALVRLLAAWTAAPAGRPAPSVVEALGRWLHWTDAIALSEALDRCPAHRPAIPDAAVLHAVVAQRREALAAAVADDGELLADLAQPGLVPEAELAACRRHVAGRQREMEAGVTALRAQLRTALAARGGDWDRLAAVDRVLADALGRREQVLLAALPSLLSAQAHRRWPTAEAGDEAARARRLCADLRQLMLAELDLRLQPVLGLLAALNTATTAAHAP